MTKRNWESNAANHKRVKCLDWEWKWVSFIDAQCCIMMALLSYMLGRD